MNDMKDVVKITIDLSWMAPYFGLDPDEPDIDESIKIYSKIEKILKDDMAISSLIRELKSSLHNTILSVNDFNEKNCNFLVKRMTQLTEAINSLMYYCVVAGDPSMIETYQFVYEIEKPFRSMMNYMPDPDLRSELWTTMVCPDSGVYDLETIVDSVATYIDKVIETRQKTIYDMIYNLRYKGLEFYYVDDVINTLITIANKLMMFKPTLEVARVLEQEARDKAIAEAEKKAAKKRTTKKKNNDEDLN